MMSGNNSFLGQNSCCTFLPPCQYAVAGILSAYNALRDVICDNCNTC